MRPLTNPNELVLSEGGCLEMQSAQRAGSGRKRMVVLNEFEVEAQVLEGRPVVDFGEEPADVAVFLRRHDLDLRYCRAFNKHRLFQPCDRSQASAGRRLLPEAAVSRQPKAREMDVRKGLLDRNCRQNFRRRPARQLDRPLSFTRVLMFGSAGVLDAPRAWPMERPVVEWTSPFPIPLSHIAV